MAQFAFQVVIGYSTAGNYAANVMHFTIEDATGADAWLNADALREALEAPSAGDSVLEGIASFMSEEAFISSLRVRQLLPVPGPESVKVFTATDFPGDVASEVEMAQVAAQVKWITDDPNHKVGKTFFPGLPSSALTAGNWDGTWLNTFAVFADGLTGSPVVTDVGNAFLAVKYAGVPNVFRDVEGWNLAPTPGTQRRRLIPY